ncbi:MAG: hypothetical protein ACK5MD_11080 [Flavobacteriales bacterium]
MWFNDNKKNLAGIILNNAKTGKYQDQKIEDGKTAYAEDVEKKLTNKTYAKGETVTFPLYKKETQMLWLDVSCVGNLDDYDKDFLKKELKCLRLINVEVMKIVITLSQDMI